ncbi:hypothetical protein RL74_06435 [Pseudomonas fluorescens]|uniref:Uncharacterized protein n=1 Tax=Pseudomonas fluorescens TaxID=294 RepID=A0A0D0PDA1_PSEFL|nr:hypothetical protein RL74_06435 [Pseudomonas fluorescens]
MGLEGVEFLGLSNDQLVDGSEAVGYFFLFFWLCAKYWDVFKSSFIDGWYCAARIFDQIYL